MMIREDMLYGYSLCARHSSYSGPSALWHLVQISQIIGDVMNSKLSVLQAQLMM